MNQKKEFRWNMNDVSELTIDTPIINIYKLKTNIFDNTELDFPTPKGKVSPEFFL